MTRIRGLKEVIERDEAVSPIIATILLVAITVILASTLYLALGGFFKTGTSSVPNVGIGASNTTTGTNQYTYSITLSNPSSNTISWASTEWIVYNGSAPVTLTYVAASGSTAATFTGTLGTKTFIISGFTGTYVTGGQVLTLTISTTTVPLFANPVSVSFDKVGSNGGQMGTTSL